MQSLWLFAILGLAQAVGAADHLTGIPTVPFTKSAGEEVFKLQDVQAILVDPEYAFATDTLGSTLIPPTLLDFATTFTQDLNSYLQAKHGNINIPVNTGRNVSKKGCIYLTLGSPGDFLDAASRETSEGYTLSITQTGITITGASPLGVWWGTRTVLQQAALSNGQLPLGAGTDAPGWGIRGAMLDIGRHYYPPSFLIEMCSYLSFFKQNTFHLHLSDNLYNNVDIYSYERQMDLYATFRPLSTDPAVAGLNTRVNESYTWQDLDNIQRKCAGRGVTIVPELEAPGHSLVITQWKPELGMSSDMSLLNISNPNTIPTMQTIWKVFLPWFHSKTVHIGADEYADASLTKE